MRPLSPPFAVLALLLAAALPARADSSASSASSAASDSIGSVSNSIQRSSNSSTGNNKFAAGDYEVVEVAQAAERPGVVRLKLQSVAEHGADGEFFLLLPAPTFERAHVAAGQVLNVREQPYGLAFAPGPDAPAFFLVLDDGWYRELQTRVVHL